VNLPAQSTEYVYCDVRAMDVALVGDPSTDAIEFAFVEDLAASPNASATWTAGSWVAGGGPAVWTARCLVGPSGDVSMLQLGHTYSVWLRFTDSPETPIVRSGTVSVV
jgi:hypothetical protein